MSKLPKSIIFLQEKLYCQKDKLFCNYKKNLGYLDDLAKWHLKGLIMQPFYTISYNDP